LSETVPESPRQSRLVPSLTDVWTVSIQIPIIYQCLSIVNLEAQELSELLSLNREFLSLDAPQVNLSKMHKKNNKIAYCADFDFVSVFLFLCVAFVFLWTVVVWYK